MNIESFKEKMGEEWAELFKPFIESSKMDDIYTKIRNDSKKNVIYPNSNDTFKAFKLIKPENVKVIIISQEPYSGQYYKSKLPQATGIPLDSSNSDNDKLQPSLEAFLQGIAAEYNLPYEEYYKTLSLSYLAEQGVLLLNRSLTVSKGKIGSHLGYWDEFFKYFFEEILTKYINIPVLILGKDAEYVKRWIFEMTHPIYILPHPSFAARTGELWDTNGIFDKITNYVRQERNFVINWSNKLYEQKKNGEIDRMISDHFLPF